MNKLLFYWNSYQGQVFQSKLLTSSQHFGFSLLLKFQLLLLDDFFPLFQELSVFFRIQIPFDFNATGSRNADEHLAHLLHRQKCIARVLDFNRRDFVKMLQRDFAGDFFFGEHGASLDASCLLEEVTCRWLVNDKFIRTIWVCPNLKIIFEKKIQAFLNKISYATRKRNSFLDFLCSLVEILAEGSDVDASRAQLWSKRRPS